MMLMDNQWSLPEAEVDDFAAEWIAAWNAHDLEQILAHYRDDVVFASPYVTASGFAPDGVIYGVEDLRRYFARALDTYPDLRFQPIATLPGVESVALHYRSVGRREAIEVMEIDVRRRVYRVTAHYGPVR
jgi:hypothetical protein